MRKIIILLAILALLFVVALSGCSDDSYETERRLQNQQEGINGLKDLGALMIPIGFSESAEFANFH